MPLIAGLLLLIACGCRSDRTASAGGVAETAVVVTPSVGGASRDNPEDCVPNESGGDRTCSNLLPADWQRLSGNALQPIAEKLKFLDSASRTASRVVQRESERRCRGSSRKPLDILLKAPVAMDSFPRAGTNQRHLVVTIFDVRRDQGCPESRYDVRQDRGNGRMSYEFTTVHSDPAGPPNTVENTVGHWYTWSLTMNRNPQNRDYVLTRLKEGDWKQCAHTHVDTVGHVAFTRCAVADAFARIASGTNSPDSAFTSLLDKHMAGERIPAVQVTGNSYSDPAWGRCGSLGCCASDAGLAATKRATNE